jgi:hypothetical protein
MERRAANFRTRVEAVGSRLGGLARPLDGLTEADPRTGERWEALQVWGHITEFVPYWIEQIEEVIEQWRGEPVPFGRTSADPGRLEGIESGKVIDLDTHRHWLEVQLADLDGFLTALTPDSFQCEGFHSRLGPMSLERMIEEFLVGHLEEHADQLAGLAG